MDLTHVVIPPYNALGSSTAQSQKEKGVEKQVSLEGADDAAEVEKRIAGLLN